MATGYPDSLKHLKNKQQKLKFRNDGTFRILHITDIHKVSPEMDDDENPEIPKRLSEETVNVIEQSIIKTDPDLVVFGGDNISGYWEEFTYDYMRESIEAITAPVTKRGIPLAVVFGNHDAERQAELPFLRKENHITMYAEYDNFRGCYNDEEMTGCGNTVLNIYSENGEKLLWNVWLVDSGDYNRDENYNQLDGYASVGEDQIEWYERTTDKITAENGGKTVPSVLFQHICVKEMLDIVEKCEKEIADFECGGNFYRAKPGTISDGLIREMPCPGDEKKQFSSWVKKGNIAAAFFGHDHTNTFTYEKNGIKLVQSIGAGYHSYGLERGARLIVLKNGREFDTETVVIPRIYKD